MYKSIYLLTYLLVPGTVVVSRRRRRYGYKPVANALTTGSGGLHGWPWRLTLKTTTDSIAYIYARLGNSLIINNIINYCNYNIIIVIITLLAVFSDESRRASTQSSDRVASRTVLTAAGVWTVRTIQVRRTWLTAGRTTPAIRTVAVSVCRTAWGVMKAATRLTAIDAVFTRLTSCTQSHSHSCTWLCFTVTHALEIARTKRVQTFAVTCPYCCVFSLRTHSLN